MGNSNSIINLGDLAKPANTLIEKISDAIGGIFKPYQIRRVAEAEGQAEKIRAAAQIDVTELQRRAMFRFIAEEAKKQQNIESITKKALPDVSEDARPQEIEDDWITNFFDKCRLISDEQMQTLWAKILAGEANRPGRFSRRTVDLLGSMDKADAILFSRLCTFAINIGGNVLPLVWDISDPIYTSHGVNFEVLSHLDTVGLINYGGTLEYTLQNFGRRVLTRYFEDQMVLIFLNESGNDVAVGKTVFTRVGEQLAPLSDTSPHPKFLEHVTQRWERLGYRIQAVGNPAGMASE
jgi:hypothetical protein